MSLDKDPYYYPEKLGLTIIGQCDRGDGWDFDVFVIWQDDATGQFYYGTDYGCSCYTAFHNATIDDLIPAEPHFIQAKLNEWAHCNGYKEVDTTPLTTALMTARMGTR